MSKEESRIPDQDSLLQKMLDTRTIVLSREIDDESIHLGAAEFVPRALGVWRYFNIDVEAAKNTFENTNFLPVAGHNQRRERHGFTLVRNRNQP